MEYMWACEVRWLTNFVSQIIKHHPLFQLPNMKERALQPMQPDSSVMLSRSELIFGQRLLEFVDTCSAAQCGFVGKMSTTDRMHDACSPFTHWEAQGNNTRLSLQPYWTRFDRVSHDVIQWTLRTQNVPKKYFERIGMIYEGAKNYILCSVEVTKKFLVKISVHRCQFCPCYFSLQWTML